MGDRSDVYIGLDLGTSSLKGVAVTAGGEIAARGHASYATVRAQVGWAEQDAADWLAALRSVVGQLLDGGAPGERWRAIGLSGMIPTLVTVDAQGAPTGAAMTWEDARAEAQGERLRGEMGESRLYELTGQWVDGRYLLPMVAWLRETEPDRVARAGRVLGAKDYLLWWLTGEYLTDPSTASGFGCYELASGGWHAGIAAAGGFGEAPSVGNGAITGGVGDTATAGSAAGLAMLPKVVAAMAARPLCGRAAETLGLPAGIPVAVGAADSVLGLLGLGVRAPGEVAYIAGTSSVIMGLSDRLVVDAAHRYLVTPLAGVAGWGLEMDLLSTGSAVHWLARTLGLGEGGEEALMELASRAPLGANGLSFLPFLSLGEQGALWDANLRGSLLGISLGHTRADIARALIEGIVLESRRCLAVLDEAGLPRGPISIAGEGGSSRFFRRLLADASGRTVLRDPVERPYSALGAAAIAAQAVGERLSLDIGGEREAVEPDPQAATTWSELWSRHETLVARAQDAYAQR